MLAAVEMTFPRHIFSCYSPVTLVLGQCELLLTINYTLF